VAANATPHDAPKPITSTSLQNLDRPGFTSQAPPLVDLDRPGNTADGGSRLDLDRPGNTSSAPRATDRDPLIRPARDVDEATYTVRRGDCLWHIAERHLGPGATSAEITREWHRWYQANRDVIGDDPDLILVGQVFRVP
jgi:nucleoid-associated protein YgaU